MKSVSLKLVALFLTATLFTITSCTHESSLSPLDDPACSGCEKMSATAEYDTTADGIYKGLLLSGTGVGHFRLDLKSGVDHNFMKMIFTRDGYPVLHDTLRCAGNLQFGPNMATNLHFLGSGSSVNIYMSGNAASYPMADFVISGSIGTGPYPQTMIYKETSTAQVKVFEGTMAGTSGIASGKVGFVVRGNDIEGIITNSSNALRETFWNGTLDSDRKFSFSFTGNNSVYTGQLTDDLNISGSFSIQGTAAGTFAATRTL